MSKSNKPASTIGNSQDFIDSLFAQVDKSNSSIKGEQAAKRKKKHTYSVEGFPVQKEQNKRRSREMLNQDLNNLLDSAVTFPWVWHEVTPPEGYVVGIVTKFQAVAENHTKLVLQNKYKEEYDIVSDWDKLPRRISIVETITFIPYHKALNTLELIETTTVIAKQLRKSFSSLLKDETGKTQTFSSQAEARQAVETALRTYYRI